MNLRMKLQELKADQRQILAISMQQVPYLHEMITAQIEDLKVQMTRMDAHSATFISDYQFLRQQLEFCNDFLAFFVTTSN